MNIGTKKWMAVTKDGEKLKESLSKAEIYQWAWNSEYTKQEIDVVAAPYAGGIGSDDIPI